MSDVISDVLEKSRDNFWNRYEQAKEAFNSNCPLNIREEYRLGNWCDENITID